MLRQMQLEQRAAQRENMLGQRQEQAAIVAQRQAQESRLAQSAELDREIKTLDYAARRLFGATPETYQSIRADLTRINPQFGAGLPAEYDDAQVKSLAMQGRSVKEQIEAATGRQRYMSTPYGPFDTEANEFRMPESLPARASAAGAAPPSAATTRPPSGYRFTDSGNLEAIPGGPAARKTAGAGAVPTASTAAPGAKPPTAAQTAKTEAQAQARQALSTELQTVLGYYDKLNKMGAMTSPEKSVTENILASARTSGPGQLLERGVATKAQTERDNISNSKFRLVRHIASITGASSKTMDSNKELQNWLDALTNPSQSIETVRETLGQLDAVIASVQSQVNKDTPAKPAAGAPAPSSANIATERANAQAAIAAGAPEAAVRERFRKNTGQEL